VALDVAQGDSRKGVILAARDVAEIAAFGAIRGVAVNADY